MLKPNKIIVASLLIFSIVAASTSCSNAGPSQPSPSNSAAVTTINPIPYALPIVVTENSVTMIGLAFQPAEITIQKGETITWTNKDAEDRDVVGRAFKSDLMGKDETYTQAFNQTGVYNYTCSVQAGMIGRIIVK